MPDLELANRQQEVHWNVLTSCWLETINTDAINETVSPLEALRRASALRCLALSSPLDLFAVHRFLLTLLLWKADAVGGIEPLRAALMQGEMPQGIFESIMAETSAFNLFDPAIPFLQDPTQRTASKSDVMTAGYLFAELATGTNIAHFHHGDDRAMHLCLPCVTLGLLGLVPWSQAGGSGKTASIHSAPPIMALATGDNLAATLGLNLVPLPGPAGTAQWTGYFTPTDNMATIPYLEALTWNPRRIHLRETTPAAVCWRCGRTHGTTVGKIVCKKNEHTKKRPDNNPFAWQDPAAFYGTNNIYNPKKSTREDQAARGGDLRVLLDEKDAPTARVVAENPEHTGWQVVIPCTNPANNKTFDHRLLEVPTLTPASLQALLPASNRCTRSPGVDGWTEPKSGRMVGAQCFTEAASSLLTHADWLILSSVAYREMHYSAAAFDILCGLFWSLRGKVAGMPTRRVAWLRLKLMASVPSAARSVQGPSITAFNPLSVLPKRQPASHHPLAFPRGHRLEYELRQALDDNQRRRTPQRIYWAGLCHDLVHLID